MMHFARFAGVSFLALGGVFFAQGCSSETTNFDSGGNGQGGGSGGGAAGSSAGTTSDGGSSPSGGSSPIGGSDTGGSNTGGTGALSTGGVGGSVATGGSAGNVATGGDAGAVSTGGTGAVATGGTGGMGGAGGAAIQCLPESDAMDMCGPVGASCLCCPIGGPQQTCICTTSCATSADCHDPARPVCNIDTRFVDMGICTADGFVCRWGTRCAAPNTPIATPQGERPISELKVGDRVYSVDGSGVVVVPIRAVRRQPVTQAHTVSRVTLVGGAVLEISAGHPTADGSTFGALRAGDDLGGVRVESVVTDAPYAYPATHDILPDSSSGAYFAAGALVGSTLADE